MTVSEAIEYLKGVRAGEPYTATYVNAQGVIAEDLIDRLKLLQAHMDSLRVCRSALIYPR